MNESDELREKAKQKVTLAYHILTKTYPFVQDPRLLLSVLENTFLAMHYTLKAVLLHEFDARKIPLYPRSFDIGIHLFELKVLRKYRISRRYLKAIKEIKGMLLHHQESSLEFARKDCFIICDDNYHLKIISTRNVREYIQIAQEFIDACAFEQEHHDRKLQRSA